MIELRCSTNKAQVESKQDQISGWKQNNFNTTKAHVDCKFVERIGFKSVINWCFYKIIGDIIVSLHQYIFNRLWNYKWFYLKVIKYIHIICCTPLRGGYWDK